MEPLTPIREETSPSPDIRNNKKGLNGKSKVQDLELGLKLIGQQKKPLDITDLQFER